MYEGERANLYGKSWNGHDNGGEIELKKTLDYEEYLPNEEQMLTHWETRKKIVEVGIMDLNGLK